MRSTNAAEYDEPRQAISIDWLSWLQTFGIMPILVPFGLQNYDAYFKLNPSGLLLTGGDSVGSLATESMGHQPTSRDRAEFAIIKQAIASHIPILGVCRGMQILNTYFGGSLCRSLEMNHLKAHDIIFQKDIFKYKVHDRITVNSFHNHGIYPKQLAKEFTVIASSNDGCIEYMEHKNLAITGIHWHPERPNEAAKLLDTQIITHRFNL